MCYQRGKKCYLTGIRKEFFQKRWGFKALAAVCQERRRREGNTSKRKSCSRRLRVWKPDFLRAHRGTGTHNGVLCGCLGGGRHWAQTRKAHVGKPFKKKKTDEKQTAAAHTLVCCAKEFGLHSEGYGVSAESFWRTTGSAPAQCRDLWF